MLEWTVNSSPIIERLSLTLLHFLWQGFVVAGTAALLTRLLRAQHPHVRYRCCVILLVIAAVTPVMTFMWLGLEFQSAVVSDGLELNAITIDRPYNFAASSSPSTISLPEVTRATMLSGWEIVHCVIVLSWLIGQLLVGVRIWLSAFFLFRIRRAAKPVQGKLMHTAEILSRKLGMRRCPPVASTALVSSAFATGLVRQTVIIPAAWLTEMTPDMLQAVVAHELAHLRRLDLWTNLFQRIVESVLFFHPAVWWLSRRIRQERELCCDELAVHVTQQRKLYVETLEHVARRAHAKSETLVVNLGDDRMSLLRRVLFVLGDRSSVRPSGLWSIGILAIAVPCAIYFASHNVETFAEEGPILVPPTQANPAPEQVRSVSLAARPDRKKPPTEQYKVTLPDYLVEPPDILLIQTVRLIPKSDYRLQVQDVLQISSVRNPLRSARYSIREDGTIDLEGVGAVYVTGLTLKEARVAIRKKREAAGDDSRVHIVLKKPVQSIRGEHLVGPDGKVNLGIYGQVFVAGLTIDQVKKAVEESLLDFFEVAEVAIDVFGYNSKVYYLIMEGSGHGDQVVRLPFTGNETVLDAIAQVGGLQQITRKTAYIMRPTKQGNSVRLDVEWNKITRGADTSTNYQLLPGDRVFIDMNTNTTEDPAGKPTEDAPPREDIDVIGLVQQYNDLMAEFRYTEAARLGKQVDEDLNHPIARLMTSHALLSQKYADRGREPIVDVDTASSRYYTETYHVADLAIGKPQDRPINLDDGKPEAEKGTEATVAEFDSLISLITSTIQPDSWQESGGRGQIQAFPTNLSLVISQNQDVHRQVAELLQQVRGLQQVQTELEIAEVDVPQAVLERLGLDGKLVAALSESERQLLLREAADDPHARVFRGAKVLLFNGQLATIGVKSGTSDETTSYQLQSVVTDDSIRLSVSREGSPQQANAIRIRSGNSILLSAVDEAKASGSAKRRLKLIAVRTVKKGE